MQWDQWFQGCYAMVPQVGTMDIDAIVDAASSLDTARDAMERGQKWATAARRVIGGEYFLGDDPAAERATREVIAHCEGLALGAERLCAGAHQALATWGTRRFDVLD